MSSLPHRLDRTVVIQAAPQTVFSFFTDSALWARWWGQGSSIEARPGGRMRIRHPNGIEFEGEVLEVDEPRRIVFSYGNSSGTPIPAGGSRVQLSLQAHPNGTRLELVHEFAESQSRDEHVQGWRFQLSLFANAVSDLVNAGAAELADLWFRAWAEPDLQPRETLLLGIASRDLSFKDRFSLIEGLDELLPHIGAALRFMPGIRVERRGEPRHCQGTLVVPWVALSSDGQERGRGQNVFTLDSAGKIRSVTGLWDPPPAR